MKQIKIKSELFNAQSLASWAMKNFVQLKIHGNIGSFCDSYSIHEIYMETFSMNQRIKWHPIVWSSISIPKTRFCCWLLALGKLKTKDRLHLIGALDDDLCPLCSASKEIDHSALVLRLPF